MDMMMYVRSRIILLLYPPNVNIGMYNILFISNIVIHTGYAGLLLSFTSKRKGKSEGVFI